MEKMQLNPGVVFFDRIPDGFGLEQLRKFFSQYGRILRTRICDIDKVALSDPLKSCNITLFFILETISEATKE